MIRKLRSYFRRTKNMPKPSKAHVHDMAMRDDHRRRVRDQRLKGRKKTPADALRIAECERDQRRKAEDRRDKYLSGVSGYHPDGRNAGLEYSWQRRALGI